MRVKVDPKTRMNKTEARYAREMIVPHGYTHRFESIKLRLADRTWYTPDFFVYLPDGTVQVVEVKGFWRDDARVKIKVAAEQYPEFRFVAARYIKKQWHLEDIG